MTPLHIRSNDEITKCRLCGSRNMVLHQDLRNGQWVHWFHCNACSCDTPFRTLRDEAIEDVSWEPLFLKVVAP